MSEQPELDEPTEPIVAYKVVHRCHCPKPNTLRSAVTSVVGRLFDYDLVYVPGEITRPKVPEQKLYVFDLLEHAMQWADEADYACNHEVWTCEVENLVSASGAGLLYPTDFKIFWAHVQERGIVRSTGIKGAMWADSVKLLEMVHKW